MMTNHTANSTSAGSANYPYQNPNYHYSNASRRPSVAPPHASPVLEQENEDAIRSRDDHEKGNSDYGDGDEEGEGEGDDDEEDDGDDDNEMDLLRMLRQDPEPEDQQREEYELVPESMASYLNRKTALLMLWFPLGVSLFLSLSSSGSVYVVPARIARR